MIKACLNGVRSPAEHEALPVTPAQLAAEARAAVTAGAGALHVHAKHSDGSDTLDADTCAAALRAIREACPGVPVGLTSGAWIEPDPERRLELVRAWTEQPDFVSVNFSEAGAAAVAGLLVSRGVGVEAGLANPDDARALAASGLGPSCLRVLLEPQERDSAEAALANAAAMERALDEREIGAPRLLHGSERAAWGVLEAALRRGLDTRIGLEDTLHLPDGSLASGNGELVRAAVALSR